MCILSISNSPLLVFSSCLVILPSENDIVCELDCDRLEPFISNNSEKSMSLVLVDLDLESRLTYQTSRCFPVAPFTFTFIGHWSSN